jgi:hypothetical protein
MCNLGDAAVVNPVIKFLRQALQRNAYRVSPSVDMLPFGVNIPATVTQGSEIPEELMNNPVCLISFKTNNTDDNYEQ